MSAILVAIGAFFIEAAPTIWTIVGLIATKIIVPAAADWLRENAASATSERLRRVAMESVGLAEEMSAREDMALTSAEKLDIATRYLVAAIPELDSKKAYDLIHSALAIAQIGASGKRKAGPTPYS